MTTAIKQEKRAFELKENEHFIEGCRTAMAYLETLKDDPKAQAIVRKWRGEWLEMQQEHKREMDALRGAK